MICRVCDSKRLEPVLDLGDQPWGNHFLRPEEVGKEPFYPLRVLLCTDCGTSQLDYTVRKETMFGDHTYLSGVTRTLSDHFRGVAEEVEGRFGAGWPDRSALDIGSNDGTQLLHYQRLGYDVLGVESSKTVAGIAQGRGVPTVNAFFNLETARSLGRRFRVINASGVFFHLEELHSFTEGVREALAEDGVFTVQFLHMKSIMENLAFDQVYHEHLLYYNATTVEKLLSRHGLALFDAYLSPIHGGSVIAFAGHAGRVPPPSARLTAHREAEIRGRANDNDTYRHFARRVERKREELRSGLAARRGAGKRIFGFGAPVKGNTLLNYCGIGTDLVECLVEKNPMRKGLFSPGMHIPVVLEEEIAAPPDVYFVLAWNFREEILRNNASLVGKGVEFWFPIVPGEGGAP